MAEFTLVKRHQRLFTLMQTTNPSLARKKADVFKINGNMNEDDINNSIERPSQKIVSITLHYITLHYIKLLNIQKFGLDEVRRSRKVTRCKYYIVE